MKKILLNSFFSTTALIVLFGASVSAQSLFTKGPGKDLTWQQIKDQNKIPTASGGLTGTDIDVNENHPLISSSPYANRKIQEGTAIHTIANGTVNKKDFHKWSRWYQEDGNTQVFRMFKGEINVGNDIYYKPRIEAELKAHSKGLNINNGADWVEWSGTYTFVEPVEANIFQIWSNDDYVLMLVMKNDGRVQLNPRDQSGFKTILENGKGKSVHIRVRDYGNKYEVFVDGEKFYSRNYTAKYGNSRAAHFRWGIYASRKKGDHGGVPKDGMMFVTGAQRRFSNEVVNTDEINSIEAPSEVTQGQTVSVSVNYNVSTTRDVTAMFQLGAAPWTVAAQATKSVSNGSGIVTFQLDVPEDLAPLEGGYKFQTYISPTGGDWGNRLDNVEKNNVDVLELEVKAPYLGQPAAIPGLLEMEYYDKGGAGISYHDDDVENRGDADFRMNDAVDVASKNGGMVVGNIADGEWLEYTVHVDQAGVYDMEFTYSSKNGGGEIGVDIDGEELVTSLSVPSTGAWEAFNTFNELIELPIGQHILRLHIESRGFDLDKIEFTKPQVTGTEDQQSASMTVFPNPSDDGIFYLNAEADYQVFNSAGTSIVNARGVSFNLSKYPKGIYYLKVNEANVRLINN